ncbi:hypothetical protein D3C76_1501720 [compost metagenome]
MLLQILNISLAQANLLIQLVVFAGMLLQPRQRGIPARQVRLRRPAFAGPVRQRGQLFIRFPKLGRIFELPVKQPQHYDQQKKEDPRPDVFH